MADKEYTLAELQAMGATPHAEPAGELSLEELKAQGAVPHEDEEITSLDSATRGAVHGGTFGFAPAIAGAGSALLDELKGDKRTLAEAYQAEREDSRKKFEAAKEAHPIAYGAGDVAGSIGSGLALAPLTGGASVAGAVGAGALAGGLQAAGDSVSENADIGEGVKNVAKGAALGGALGGLGAGAGKLVGAGLKKLAPSAEAIERAAAAGAPEPGVAFLDKMAARGVNRATSGGLNPLASVKGVSDEAALHAIDNGGVKFYDTAQSLAKRTGELQKSAGEAQGGLTSSIASKGVTVPGATIADQLRAAGNALEKRTLGSSAPGRYRAIAEELAQKAEQYPAGKVPLDVSEGFKRSLQDQATAEYQRVGGSTELGRANKDLASTMMAGGENAVAEQSPEDLKAFLAAKKATGYWTNLNEAAQKGAARADKRAWMGLPAKTAAMTAMATGHIPGAALTLATPAVLQRLPAATAVAARSASLGVSRVAKLAAANPAALGKYGGVLSRAVAQGPAQFATANFILSKDPGYQAHVQHLDDTGQLGE